MRWAWHLSAMGMRVKEQRRLIFLSMRLTIEGSSHTIKVWSSGDERGEYPSKAYYWGSLFTDCTAGGQVAARNAFWEIPLFGTNFPEPFLHGGLPQQPQFCLLYLARYVQLCKTGNSNFLIPQDRSQASSLARVF